MPWLLLRRALVRPILAVRIDFLFLLKELAKLRLPTTGTVLLVACTGFAQSPFASSIDTAQGKVLIPVSTSVLGQRDPAALTELTDHLAAVGTASWVGLQGTGKITYGSKDTSSYDATLYNLGADAFRLDAQTSKGEMSIRIHGRAGKIKDSDGTPVAIPPDTAMFGLFPFELPRLKHFPRPGTSLIDHGLTVVDGTELHRITFGCASIGRNPVTKSRETLATDLYFDPQSHLLIKSVAHVQVAANSHVKLLSVVTYGDYRKVDTSMIPFRYTETMEGELYWTLQLADVQLNPSINSTYFEF